MKKKVATIFAVLAILSLVVPTFAQGPDVQVPDSLGNVLSAKGDAEVYIVRMLEDPVIAYEGGIPGLPATKPAKGQKINPNSAKVRKYVDFLDSRHNAALNAVNARGRKLYDYRYSFNGFSAELTSAEAAVLRAVPGVLTVEADFRKFPVTDNSPDFLGLTAEGGLFSQDVTGEDVIIGVVDTGIWPEHPSFSDRTGTNPNGKPGKLNYRQLPGWHGKCVPGEEFNASMCNQKLIGAQYFFEGFGLEDIEGSGDYLSVRDHDGHGTHTASTAGGNHGIEASIFGIDRGLVSGIAPRARIAAYKACWADEGCAGSDLVAAIDQAVADGVDVINYSIGGGSTSLLTADAVAFLFAADAGVFVATSAGNSGPAPSTLGNPAVVPWVTTVGASTQDRTFQGSVQLGSGAEVFGASITGGTDVLPLVDSADAALDPGDDDALEDAELCIPEALDPAVVAGKIVLCLRGEIARVDKSLAVSLAGGAGTVLYNANDAQSLNADNHWTPAVHINNTDGLAVKSYIATAGASATAQIVGGEFTTIPAPWMADFSSRGPNGGAPDIVKPDITAPGVNILAGNSPTPFLGAPGQLFQAIGGTSMSSPHVAGAFALLKQAHPDWTPAMAKSALMTTAYQDGVFKEDGVTPADPFDMGAGHLNPNPSVDPGLVYDAGFNDYIGFLCGVGALNCSGPDPSDLNLASIGIAELAGFQTISRTVTSVTPGTATYNVSVDAPAGIDVAVSPASLTLNEGESATYEVTFTTTESADIGEWVFGSLTWSHGPHSVRSPIAIKPVGIAAPDEVSGNGTDGSLSYGVTFGYTGDFAAEPHGLIAAATEDATVVDDPANDINTALDTGVGITVHAVAIPSGTEYARFSLFNTYTDGDDDLDLYVFGPDTADFPFVGSSGSPTSDEEVNLVAPDPGTYLVVVHGWETDGPDANYTLFNWALDAADAGNMTVTEPSSAVLGGDGTITVDWFGLAENTKYLGNVTYHDVASPTGYDDGLIDFTIVRIDTD